MMIGGSDNSWML